MSSSAPEIHLHNNGCQKARNGNGRSANYDNSYDEKKDSYRFKKPSKYVRSDIRGRGMGENEVVKSNHRKYGLQTE